MTDTVLIIDFGSQVTQLIARRVREQGVYSEIVPFNRAEDALERLKPKAVILSGGPASVTEFGTPRAPDWVFKAGLPVLGICYGEQTMVAQMGGGVEGGHHREFGRAELEVTGDSAAVRGRLEEGRARHRVDEPRRPRHAAAAPASRWWACRRARRSRPSPTRSASSTPCSSTPRWRTRPRGSQLIGNFVRRIAGLPGDWSMAHFQSAEIAKIRAQVGKGRVICGLSGGVDSAVAAVLIHEAIGDQLTCIFVDHGLLRLNEAKEVVSLFRGHFNIPLVHVDAQRALPRRARRQDRPRGQAQDHRRALHRRVRRGGQEARRRRVPGPGHALPRRDRERVVHRRAVGDHQVAPQRRRPARAHEPEAGRAAARAVQGRGARAGPRAGAARAFHLAPSVPGAGPRHPHPGRGDARRSSTSCARPTPSSSTRSARPASTTRSGRPSPCCCPCAPSASWATRAPTTTSARCAPSPPPTA